MLFKNILFELGGTAVVGGVGYGIYAASQSDSKDVKEGEGEGSTDKEEGSIDEEGEKHEESDSEEEETEPESGNEGGESGR